MMIFLLVQLSQGSEPSYVRPLVLAFHIVMHYYIFLLKFKCMILRMDEIKQYQNPAGTSEQSASMHSDMILKLSLGLFFRLSCIEHILSPVVKDCNKPLVLVGEESEKANADWTIGADFLVKC